MSRKDHDLNHVGTSASTPHPRRAFHLLDLLLRGLLLLIGFLVLMYVWGGASYPPPPVILPVSEHMHQPVQVGDEYEKSCTRDDGTRSTKTCMDYKCMRWGCTWTKTTCTACGG